MTMKKAERKAAYEEMLLLMEQEKHAEAWSKLVYLCGRDTGIYHIGGYEARVERQRFLATGED